MGLTRAYRLAVIASVFGAALALGAARTPADESPVADAVMRGDSARVRVLIKQGLDVNAAQPDGMTALHWAAQRGDAGGAQMLMYAGARVDAVTRNGNYTPLHLAARNGRTAAVKALLAALPLGAIAQSAADYPNKPIELVVPFGAGGGRSDVVCWLAAAA